MLIEPTIRGMQQRAERLTANGRRLALVPTMGSLHEGHLRLVDAAKREADHVTVSIFVNPTQFGPDEDLDQYPRDLEQDAELLRGRGADVVFAPSVEEMYPAGAEPVTWVVVDRLGEHLCGAARPGHFRGVSTIVSKLFIACRPDVAVFGLKDAQQFFLLKRMTQELGFSTTLVGVPTVREPDGLAMSSRNRYLVGEDRTSALALSRAVAEATRLMQSGERRAANIERAMRQELENTAGVRVDYASVVETSLLQPVARIEPGMQILAAVAAFVGPARLIDNTIVTIPGS